MSANVNGRILDAFDAGSQNGGLVVPVLHSNAKDFQLKLLWQSTYVSERQMQPATTGNTCKCNYEL